MKENKIHLGLGCHARYTVLDGNFIRVAFTPGDIELSGPEQAERFVSGIECLGAALREAIGTKLQLREADDRGKVRAHKLFDKLEGDRYLGALSEEDALGVCTIFAELLDESHGQTKRARAMLRDAVDESKPAPGHCGHCGGDIEHYQCDYCLGLKIGCPTKRQGTPKGQECCSCDHWSGLTKSLCGHPAAEEHGSCAPADHWCVGWEGIES
jgi:hypothetical protein